MSAVRKARVNPFLLSLCLLLSSVTLGAQAKPLVSVLAFTAENVGKAEAATITRFFEAELSRLGAFTVVEQSEADKILKAQELSRADCTDEACAIEIGKMLSAQNIFVGTLSRIENSFFLAVKLIDVTQGRNLKTETVQAPGIQALSEKLKDVAFAMRDAGMVTAGKASIVAEEESAEPEQASVGVQATSSYVTFESNPPQVGFSLYDSAGAFIPGSRATTSKALRLSFGRYTVKAQDSAGLYYPFEFRFDVNAQSPRKFAIPMELKPNFGSLDISTVPSGADILKDGIKVGTTPMSLVQLKSGKHSFTLQMPLYEPKTVAVTMEDGKASKIAETLDAAFVVLSVAEKGSLAGKVYVDGALLGALPVVRRQVEFRDFSLRVVPDDPRYKEYTEKVTVKMRGENVDRQTAFVGSMGILNVETDPYCEGDIFIDGKKAGTSPESLDLLVGTCEVKVSGKIKGIVYSGSMKAVVTEGKETTLTVPVTSAVYDALQKEIEAIAGRITPDGPNVEKELSDLAALRSRIAAEPVTYPELTALIESLRVKGGGILSHRTTQKAIADLTARREAVEVRIASLKRDRDGWGLLGWISLGLGVSGSGLGGYAWYAADDAYTRYNATTYTAEAEILRGEAKLWNTTKIASLATGGVGLGLSLLSFLLSPSTADLEKESAGLLAEITRLEGEIRK